MRVGDAEILSSSSLQLFTGFDKYTTDFSLNLSYNSHLNLTKCFFQLPGVFGSRMKSYKSALKGGMPVYKFLGNIFLTFIQNIILSSKISEFHSGYRSFRVSSLKEIEFNEKANYYHFDTEIIIEMLKKNDNELCKSIETLKNQILYNNQNNEI